MKQRFEDRVALVTGAASGIGRASAQLLASEGARVACCDINLEGAEETAQAIEESGGKAIAVLCDVSSSESTAEAVAHTVGSFAAVNVLANVAGIGSFQRFETITIADWNRVLGINLNGTFFMSQAALPHLLDQKGNCIVNVASLAGLIGQAYSAAYCVSKAGVVSLTRCMAIEFLKRGLRVNCICPGVVETPIIQNFLPPEDADLSLVQRLSIGSRMSKPAHVAEAIAYLASDAAATINGVALPMDSGVHAG
jgi:meso-butanediol dehydrogenase/(S,S)-butanediol dehydrogenase/diacetyl reductase